MNDQPQAEACASECPVTSESHEPAADHSWDACYDRVAAILPRLITISASVVLIGPALLPSAVIDSFGHGVRGC
ncbi:MAG: hypothetical protein WCJ55_00060 [Chloroflexales bacterium]